MEMEEWPQVKLFLKREKYMILQDNLKVKVGSKQIKYYSSLGYKVSMGDEILIKNEEALPGCRIIEERKGRAWNIQA